MGVDLWDLAGESPTLSLKEEHNLFSRTVAPIPSKGPTLISLMMHYKWMKTIMMTITENFSFESGLLLADQFRVTGIQITKLPAFVSGRFNADILREIKRLGIRVIMLIAYDKDMAVVAAHAHSQEMIRAGWAWVLPYTDESYRVEEMQGWIFVQALLPSEGMQAFAKQVSDYSASGFNITVSPHAVAVDLTYSVALHDAIMLYAYAATKILSEGGDLRDGQAVARMVRSTMFKGVGGQVVALNEKGDRIESYEVMNYVLEADGGIGSVAVGTYDSTMKQYRAYERVVVWPGNTLEIPVDYCSGAPDMLPRSFSWTIAHHPVAHHPVLKCTGTKGTPCVSDLAVILFVLIADIVLSVLLPMSGSWPAGQTIAGKIHFLLKRSTKV